MFLAKVVTSANRTNLVESRMGSHESANPGLESEVKQNWSRPIAIDFQIYEIKARICDKLYLSIHYKKIV